MARQIRRMHERRWREKLGLFVAEGEDLVDAAREAGVEPVELLVAGETVEPALLAEVSTLAHPPRVVGIFRKPRWVYEEVPRGGLALWNVRDPGNLGTLIRSADAFGARIHLSEGCADPYGPKALRAAMGSTFRVALLGWVGVPFDVALVPRAGIPLAELPPVDGFTFVLGGERVGLPPEIVEACTFRATIPQVGGAESLNVAMAGTIALYEDVRRRSSAP